MEKNILSLRPIIFCIFVSSHSNLHHYSWKQGSLNKKYPQSCSLGISDVKCEIFKHKSLATSQTSKTKCSLQVETKQPSRRAQSCTTFQILPETFPKYRIRTVENLHAVIPIPITIQTEKFANLFVTPKISRILEKGENQSLDDMLNFMETSLGV